MRAVQHRAAQGGACAAACGGVVRFAGESTRAARGVQTVARGGGDDAGCWEVYESPGTLPAYAVHHCELGDFWIYAGTAGDCECVGAIPGEDTAGSDGQSDASDSD